MPSTATVAQRPPADPARVQTGAELQVAGAVGLHRQLLAARGYGVLLVDMPMRDEDPLRQLPGLVLPVINRLVDLSRGHKKIILYANPGTEGFYTRLGFLRMNTAMAIWQDQAAAVASGLLRAEP